MASAKEIEELGLKALRKYTNKRFPGSTFEVCNNKGNKRNRGIGDAILTMSEGAEYHIELKASAGSSLPTNIRFTHQTIMAAQNRRLLVAYVYNLQIKPKFLFFNYRMCKSTFSWNRIL